MSKQEFFLTLDPDEQAEIITSAAQTIGMEPYVVEKDLWVCWALQQLFSMPDNLKMVFKGGTSLSKAFNAIYRFSEDIDITIDYKNFTKDVENPFREGISKTAQKKLSDSLKKQLSTYLHETIAPYFEKIGQQQFNNSISIVPAEEEIRIQYASVIPHHNYVKSEVLLEFGARNVTDPHENHLIESYLKKYIDNSLLILPEFTVPILSPQRTFWEKATLMHVECNRIQAMPSAERLSRHWYDLTMLSRQAIGKAALEDIPLLKEVIAHKKVFFNRNKYNYDACLDGEFLLLPKDALHTKELEQDHKKMVSSGMFFKEPPSFKDIVEELQVLETKINERIAGS